MPKCEWCGESFDLEDAELEFDAEAFLLVYRNVRKCLCGACALEAIEDKTDGIYYETCDKCGKTFDLILEESAYSNHFSWFNGTSLRDEWGDNGIICADCAIELADSEDNEDSDEYDSSDDSEDEGCIACGNPAYPECKSSCRLFDD